MRIDASLASAADTKKTSGLTPEERLKLAPAGALRDALVEQYLEKNPGAKDTLRGDQITDLTLTVQQLARESAVQAARMESNAAAIAVARDETENGVRSNLVTGTHSILRKADPREAIWRVLGAQSALEMVERVKLAGEIEHALDAGDQEK